MEVSFSHSLQYYMIFYKYVMDIKLKLEVETFILFMKIYQVNQLWPAGDQIKICKINRQRNRVVNHFPSPNPTFLLQFWKARGILS